MKVGRHHRQWSYIVRQYGLNDAWFSYVHDEVGNEFAYVKDVVRVSGSYVFASIRVVR